MGAKAPSAGKGWASWWGHPERLQTDTVSPFTASTVWHAFGALAIRVDGYAPLNFISGGSVRDEAGSVIPDRTHSDRTAHSDILMFGVNVGF